MFNLIPFCRLNLQRHRPSTHNNSFPQLDRADFQRDFTTTVWPRATPSPETEDPFGRLFSPAHDVLTPVVGFIRCAKTNGRRECALVVDSGRDERKVHAGDCWHSESGVGTGLGKSFYLYICRLRIFLAPSLCNVSCCFKLKVEERN